MLSLLDRFLLEWVGTKHCPPLREWQERGQNDHQSLRKEGQTVRKEGQTTLDSQSFPFSFLSFGPPSSFEGPSESFRKDRNFSNDLRRRSKRGEGWEKSRVISPIENHPTFFIPSSFVLLRSATEWCQNEKMHHSAAIPKGTIIERKSHSNIVPFILSSFQAKTSWKWPKTSFQTRSPGPT